MIGAYLANSAWQAASRLREDRFARALFAPDQTQQRVLETTLRNAQQTAFGKQHHINPAWSIREYQQHIPLGDYDTHLPYIHRIRDGEHHVLTADRVTHLIPTSGSAGPRKLIPHTAGLQAQFNRALGPWVCSMFRAQPGIKRGPAYWAVSPSIPDDQTSQVPIGFEDDTAYLGFWSRKLVGKIMAVPSEVRHLRDLELFRYQTLRHLILARELALVSVWHPSFLSLLLDALPIHWEQLMRDLPEARAAELRKVEPSDLQCIWPGLVQVSAWADAAAAIPFAHLRTRLPGVRLEPKGLIASECWTTIPYHDHYPLAINVHVFEFIDDAGQIHLPAELDQGAEYETIVTTAGGLYRYRTGDRVVVTGRLARTPTLRFLGRTSSVSDTCGEKLSEAHVARVILETFNAHRLTPEQVLLGPEFAAAPTRYLLCIRGSMTPPPMLVEDLDQALRTNPHYDLCRRLGQLELPKIHWRSCASAVDPEPSYQIGATPLGAVKPKVLVGTDEIGRWLSRQEG